MDPSGGHDGPAVSVGEFDAVFERVRAWGRFENPSGAMWQTLGRADVTAAAGLVSSGRVVQMALPWNTQAGPDNLKPALHYMTDLGVREPPEPSSNKDFLGVDFHGKAVTHLDALSHIAYRGRLFDGNLSSDVVTACGADFGSVAALGPLVTSGVLIDVAAARGVEWLEPGTAIMPDDILAAERIFGTRIEAGDAVLVRTGHFARRRALGPWDSDTTSAGLHVSCMPLLADRGIVALGSDGDSDARPAPTPGIHSPIHILALTAMGVPLLDNVDLEELSRVAREESRYRFMLTVAPLNVERGTGCPVNPIAVF